MGRIFLLSVVAEKNFVDLHYLRGQRDTAMLKVTRQISYKG